LGKEERNAMTPHEEQLMAVVNLRVAQRKKEARWWWLAGWQEVAWLIFSAAILFWASRTIGKEFPLFFPLGFAVLILGFEVRSRFEALTREIEGLEARIKSLEEKTEPNQSLQPTALLGRG
jgi:hypothetical protein